LASGVLKGQNTFGKLMTSARGRRVSYQKMVGILKSGGLGLPTAISAVIKV
jgi:hypothetical protein